MVQRGNNYFDALNLSRDGETLTDLKCPISGDIMQDPVRAEDGIT